MKAVIYDMDGLMIDSEPLSFKAMEIMLKNHGKSLDDIPMEIRKNSLGRRVIDIVEEYSHMLEIPADSIELYNERNKIFMELIRAEVKPMKGLKKSLEFFKGNGYKIAMASSAIKEYIDFIIDKFEIREYFDIIVSGGDVKNGKPDPETYIIAAKKLEVEPAECMVLEDAENGIKAAIDAGCKCIAIPGTGPEQDYSIATKTIGSLEELNEELIDELDNI